MSYLLVLPAAGFLFYIGYNLRTAFYLPFTKAPFRERREGIPLPFISVIIPARNESRNIGNCLSALKTQDYPREKFEILVVDDHSEDDTGAKAKFFAEPGLDLRVFSLEEGEKLKKAAIRKGIAEAKGNIILTTDADCIAPAGWLRAIAACFDEQTDAVSGPVKLIETGTAFSKIQALEFMGLVATGASAIQLGAPTLANGANFAYRKEIFEKLGGFSGNEQHPSGDDEFLLHKISMLRSGNVRFAADPEAVVSTPTQENWKSFWAQRIRWVSKSGKYERKGITLSLSLIWLGMWIFPALLMLSFSGILWFWLFFIAWMVKVLSEALVLFPASRFFRNSHLLVWLPIESLLHVAYVIGVGIAGNFSSYQWKGRKLN